MKRLLHSWLPPLFSVLLLLCACSISGYEDRYRVSDQEVREIIHDSSYPGDLQKREPNPRKVQTIDRKENGPVRASEAPEEQVLTLKECMDLALENNRELLNQLENTALARIDAQVEKHRYSPVIQPVTISHNRTGSQQGTRNSFSESAQVSVEQRLPAGGQVRAGSRFSNQHGSAIDDSQITPFLSTSVPLLRGSGLVTAQEGLINAVRSKRYARRELRDFKQNFIINIIDRYFSILQQQKTIKNIENRLKSARQLRQQSDIQFEVEGSISKVDVFRARFQETEAERDLQTTKEQLKLTKDALKIDLNLPQSTSLTLADREIQYSKGEFPEKEFVKKALNHNLLWQNQKEQYQDAKRRIKVASNQTLPSLDLQGNVQRSYDGDANFAGQEFDDTDWSLGLTLDLPIDRTFLNRDLHRSIVQFQQQERQLSLARDRLIQQVREQINQLRQARFNVRASRRSLEQARKAVELLEQQYKRGEVDNRDLIDEQNNLLRSQNSLLRARVDWKIRRLELKQTAGQLSVDNRNQWLQLKNR